MPLPPTRKSRRYKSRPSPKHGLSDIERFTIFNARNPTPLLSPSKSRRYKSRPSPKHGLSDIERFTIFNARNPTPLLSPSKSRRYTPRPSPKHGLSDIERFTIFNARNPTPLLSPSKSRRYTPRPLSKCELSENNYQEKEPSLASLGNLTTPVTKNKISVKLINTKIERGKKTLIDPDFLDFKNISGNHNMMQTLDIAIPENEDQTNEFKSTFRADLARFEKGDGKLVVKPDVEKEISIAIAAMANNSGGKLFIGVGDAGEAIGLSHDYELIKNCNDDKFELMLRESIHKHLQDLIFETKLTISLQQIEDKKIWIIKIPASSQPIFTHIPHEEFYVRMGPKSQKFTLKDFFNYSKDRFSE